MPGMEIWNSVKQVQQNLKPCQAWEQNQADNDAKRQELKKKNYFTAQQLEESKQRGTIIINATNKLNRYSDNKVQDVSAGTGYIALLAKIPCALAAGLAAHYGHISFANGQKPGGKEAVMMAGFLASFIPSIPMVIWRTQEQKEASRVARYQAREKVLNDPELFVVHTPEEIEKANKIADSMPDIQKKTTAAKFDRSGHSLIKDNKNYKKWKKENIVREKERQKLYNTVPLTPEEQQKAKNDQDLIFRTISKVDKKAKEYSFTTDMVAGIILSLPIFTAALIEKPLTYLGAFKNEIFKTSILGPEFHGGPKLSTVISGMIAFAATLPVSLALRKDAAQIGRFKAQQELSSDPNNFASYDENQMDSVKNIKAPKIKNGFFNDLINDIIFVPRSFKDYLEYRNYKKAHDQQDLKFQQALKQVPITQKQLKDAKELQSKLFRTFDKMDDMSQRYSQDAEGAAALVECVTEELGIGILALGGILLSKYKTIGKIKNNLNTTSFSDKLSSYNPIKNLSKAQQKSLQQVMSASKGLLIFGGAFTGILCLHAGLALIKKQAARVGIMKATQDLSDYRNFANYDDQKINQDQENKSYDPNLYAKFLRT